MYLWKKNRWCLGVIYFVIIFAVSLIRVSSLDSNDLEINYPKEVTFNEEFNVKINFESVDLVAKDVKIDVLDNAEKRISRIFDKNENKFKSTNYYIKNIGNIDTFKLKISEQYSGNAEIFVTINSESDKKTKFGPYKINIGERNSEKDERNEQKITESILDSTEKIANKTIESNVIDLRSQATKSIKSDSDTEVLFKSTNQKIKERAIYFFMLFCLIISSYFIIKQYVNKNTDKNDEEDESYVDN